MLSLLFFHGRFLVKVSNSADSSASRAQILLSQPPLQSSNDSFVTVYISSARTTSKTPFLYCCLSVRFRGNVFTEPLLTNGRLSIPLLHINGYTRFQFRDLCLATGLHAWTQFNVKAKLRGRGVETIMTLLRPNMGQDGRMTKKKNNARWEGKKTAGRSTKYASSWKVQADCAH
jgi:hypothetical protein